MKKIFTLLLCSLLSISAFATNLNTTDQDTPPTRSGFWPALPNHDRDGFQLTYAPLSNLDYFPRWRVGAAYQYGAFRFLVDAGRGSKALNHWRWQDEKNNLTDAYSLHEIRTEFQFTTLNYAWLRFYTGVELFYVNMDSQPTNSHYYTSFNEDQEKVHFDQADYNKRKMGFNLKAGYETTFMDPFSIEMWIGLGAANRKITYTNIINPRSEQVGVTESLFQNRQKTQGIKIVPSVAFGFRLACRLF
ncbi:hypothetical protein [Persicobacter psychrovividus]|uniref:Outer membrane protein beta-barrel domain-containing protein n=1 Tax=Persicobacter psychrovividus TaxID=387638 RepID=A0ABM7VEP7_9BACT|nr:hypothetical protein PEPS_17470 [Persicobacter psychrovividus]